MQFWKVSLTWVEPGKWWSSCGLSFEFNFQWKVYGSIQTTKVNSVPYFTNKMKHSKHLPERKEFWDKFDFKVNVVFRRTQWKYLIAITWTDFFLVFRSDSKFLAIVLIQFFYILITVHTHRVYFYTQCIPTQNVLFLHPSSDLLHCVFYTHQVYFYTQYVVLHSVCKKSWFTLFCREIRFVYIYALLGVKFCL